MVLQAGPYRIPLVKDRTGIMRFDDGFYVAVKPEAIGGEDDLLIDFRPYAVEAEELVTFECVVRYYAVLEVRAGMNFVYLDESDSTEGIILPDEPVSPQQRQTRTKCDYIIAGGGMVATAIQWSGGFATQQVQEYGKKKREAINEAEQKGDVDEKTLKRWKQTEVAAGYALQGANIATGILDTMIGKAASYVGDKGAGVAVDKNGKETKRGALMRGTGAGLQAWNIVWEQAEETGLHFLKAGEIETTQYCDKVYGPKGAEAASTACQSAAATAKAGYKIGTIGGRQVIKKTAKEAGKQYTKGAATKAEAVRANK